MAKLVKLPFDGVCLCDSAAAGWGRTVLSPEMVNPEQGLGVELECYLSEETWLRVMLKPFNHMIPLGKVFNVLVQEEIVTSKGFHVFFNANCVFSLLK